MNLDAVLLALAGALTLRAAYSTLRVEWPMSYYELDSGDVGTLDPVISRSPLRYTAFRVGPVFLMVTFVVVTATRWGRNPWLVGGLATVMYLLVSLGAASFADGRRGTLSQRRLAYWAASGVLVALGGLAAVMARELTEGLVPHPNELVAGAWAGAFVVALARASQRSLSTHNDPYSQLHRSRSELDPTLVLRATELCAQHAASQELVMGILVVENLQRPRWFRRLERLKARMTRGVTSTGVMQVRSTKPLTDLESVELAVQMLAGTERLAEEDRFTHALRVAPTILSYNSNVQFQRALSMTRGMNLV